MKPTVKQVRFFENHGIVPPPTRAACSSLIAWIERGGEESGKRISIIRETHNQFVGKWVERLGAARIGKVEYLICRGLGARAVIASGKGRYTHPLDALMRWEDGETSITSIGSLRVIPEE